MKPFLHIKNPLVRGGTSQQQRPFRELDPEYVLVDERTDDEYINFAISFSKFIQYYNDKNQRNGDWSPFFDEELKDEPHYSLFLTFLRLLHHAKVDINKITGKHLNFYYQTVLGMKRKKAKPDKVHVAFELAKNTPFHQIKKGTKLSAGKDETGVERVYQLDEEIVVNKTQVSDIRSVYFDPKSGRLFNHILELDGEVAQPLFGGDELAQDPEAVIDIGFAVSSPILWLAEGIRKVTVTLSLISKLSDEAVEADPEEDFLVYFSGAKDWIGPVRVSPELSVLKIKFIANIPREESAVVGFDPEVLSGNFEHAQPVMKVMINNSSNRLNYELLRHTNIDSCKIEVDVSEIRGLVVQNDLTVLDPNKPFQPFGPRPSNGANFYIGNHEIFRKEPSKINLNFSWQSPPTSFDNHYQQFLSYSPGKRDMLAENLVAKLDVLINKQWYPVELNAANEKEDERKFERAKEESEFDSFQLFVTEDKSGPRDYRNNAIELTAPFVKDNTSGSKEELIEIVRVPNLDIGKQFSLNSTSGFFRIKLDSKNTDFAAFGHDYFPRLYAEKVIQKAAKPEDNSIDLPKEPYTPVIDNISLSYSASREIHLTWWEQSGPRKREYDKFYHIGPYGETEKQPLFITEESAARIPLLDPFRADGTCYLGLVKMEPSQNVSMLFQVEEGSADPALIGKINLEWSYLQDNEWIPFDEKALLSDSTKLLIQSGIIKFRIPASLSTKNTILPPGFLWIRGTVSYTEEVPNQEMEVSAVNGIGKILAIKTQAVGATFLDQDNDPNHLKVSLPAKEIKKLVLKDGAIKSVLQPFPSFKGKMAEQEGVFYTRVSERLRHKSRGIAIWDYERLILEKFPSIYKVRCLNHTGRGTEFAPGHVTIIVVSNLRQQHSVNLLEPITSISVISEIIDFLKPRISPFIKLEVKNPDFEKIRLHFDVKFHEQFDEGFYLRKLESDINRYLSPWAYEEGADLSFEGSIHRSAILNYVEERPYVDFVTCFKMDHVVHNDLVYTDIDEAIAASSSSILVSAGSHDIQLMTSEDCSCEDRVKQLPPPADGIGAMIVEFNFRVHKEDDNGKEN